MDRQNIVRDCFMGSGLAKKLITLATKVTTAAAAGDDSTVIEVPKNRGNVIGLSVKIANATIATLDGYTVTVASDGANIIETSPAVIYSTLYDINDRIYRTFIPGGSVINFIVTQDAAAASVIAYLEMFFDGKESK
jgi:hypothetical protein